MRNPKKHHIICADCGSDRFSSTKIKTNFCSKCLNKNGAKRRRANNPQTKALENLRSKNYYQKNKHDLQFMSRLRYNSNRAYRNESSRAYKRTDKARWNLLNKVSRKRWDSIGFTFDEYQGLIRKPCHYCQRSLENMSGYCLDRKDNSIGYQLFNVLPCCGDCNMLKSDMLTVEEMEVAMRAILEYRSNLKP